jgi:hypothetical protein
MTLAMYLSISAYSIGYLVVFPVGGRLDMIFKFTVFFYVLLNFSYPFVAV